MLQKNVILTAQTLGFFRAKDPEKQALIFEDLLELTEFENENPEVLGGYLESEIIRRQRVYADKASRSHDLAMAKENRPLSGGVDNAHSHVEQYPPGLYVLTCAQNNTDVDIIALGALKTYCAENSAKLLCAKITYNKNGFLQHPDIAAEGLYYDPAVIPFLVEGQINLGGAIEFVAQANVSPTAKNPLSGFESITPVGVSVVVPASKIALKCTAALKGGQGKQLYSTGTITKRNYILRKVGAIAATEHNIGGLLVDTRSNPLIVRQLEIMPGFSGFYDMPDNSEQGARYYTQNVSMQASFPSVLQFGDIHAEKMDPENLVKLCNMIRKYKPEHLMIHDLMDFSTRNHHNVKDCAFIYSQTVQKNTVQKDINKVFNVVNTLVQYLLDNCEEEGTLHIIESNHDLAINTWLKNADFKADPENALVYLKCMLALYEHIQETGNADFNMLEFAYNGISDLVPLEKGIVFHKTDESVIIAGVEHGNHGHTGINGSRGSPTQFRSLGIALNTGHTHSPSINGGCYTAGVSASLEMGYNVGPSSWRLAHILTWPNGQRQVIFM